MEKPDKVELYLREAFAFTLHRAKNPQADLDSCLSVWHHDIDTRCEVRKAARELLASMSECGIKLVKCNLAKLNETIEQLQTVPAKRAYSDDELT